MSLVARKVQVYIGIGKLYGLGAAVNGMDKGCPSTHGIDGEAACIAEHVEDALALCVFLKEQPVLTLVNEEASLLSLQPVYMEQQPVLLGGVLIATSIDEAVLLPQVSLEGKRGLTLIINVLYPALHNLDKGRTNLHAADVHAYAMGLHDGSFAIAVDDQSRQVVALAMHKAIGVVVVAVGNAEAAPYLQSRGKPRLPKLMVDGDVAERQYPDRYGAYLVMAYGQERAVRSQHPYDVALGYSFITTQYGTREYPRMEPPERLLLASFQIYVSVHGLL